MGWDAFGLLKQKMHLNKQFESKNGRLKILKQWKTIKLLGLSIDLEKEISLVIKIIITPARTVHWFLQKGPVLKETYVNWDPVENTVLAIMNRLLMAKDGDLLKFKEKTFTMVFNITKFKQSFRRFKPLDGWPEKVKLMQKNWIVNHLDVKLILK